MPFFQNVENLSLTTSIFQHCADCGRNLGKNAISLSGIGQDRILVIFPEPDTFQSQATRNVPGTSQQIQGDWIAGTSSILSILNTHYRSQERYLPDCIWATGVLQCPSISKKSYDVVPCLKKLDQTIKETQPIVIFAVGKKTTGAVFHLCFPHSFGQNCEPSLYFGHQIPLDRYNAYLIPVMSDSDIEESPRESHPVAKKHLYSHVHSGLALKDSRPFKPGERATPDSSQIQFLSHVDAPTKLEEYSNRYKYAAFDYETTTLHPEATGAKVLCASVCFGNSNGKDLQTVVFPFSHSSIVEAWRKFLGHPIYKLGANIKFETRWSTVYFQQPVTHWYWDCNAVGHILDCEEGTANLKFLATAYFGVCGYNKVVERFIKSDTEYGTNRLTEVPFQELFTYCAIDSILTFRAAKRQHEILKRKF